MTGAPWLLAGGMLSAMAAVLHLCCILGGPAWYRVFGAGDRMVRRVGRGSPAPTLITLAIAGTLAIWAAYALSGAGLIAPLPLLRPVLVIICAIYLLRATALPVLFRIMPDRSPSFLLWSSAIVLIIGLVHAIGLAGAWSRLAAGG